MARKRKLENCASQRIVLCDDNLVTVQKVKAGFKRQASISDALNKIIKEWSFFKDNKPLILR